MPIARIRVDFKKKRWEEFINWAFPPIGDTIFVQYCQDVVKNAGIEVGLARDGMMQRRDGYTPDALP